MRLLQVLAGAKRGGAEAAFVDMCIAYHEAGQEVAVVTRSNDLRVPDLRQAGITVHTLPFGGVLDVYTPMKMRGIIRDFRPDIVQTWMSRASSKTPRWRASMGVPPYKVVARLGGYYKLKYFRNVDYFATITPDIKQYLVESGVREDRVRHINNFAETEDHFTPLDRGDYGVPTKAPLLLGLGRLHPAKAFDTLIRAVADLEGVYLWIAGEGPQRAELEALIRDLKAQDRVRLLGWRSDRAALFDMCDICFFSSRYEPFGTVFVQAWANKTPLITTDADGPRQFVCHEEDGLVVKIDDLEGFKDAISCLNADSGLQKTFVKNGYQRYLNEFTKDKTVEAYISYFQDILKTPV